jgi:hypothetical protein
MKKNYLSMLLTICVLLSLALFSGIPASQAQSAQDELVRKNIAFVNSDIFTSLNLMLRGDLILPDSAVMFEHPSNKKVAVVSWPEYDEHGNAYVIETYDYVTKDKGKIVYKYGNFPYYHGIYEYSRPLEYTVYAWENENFIASGKYVYQYDSNGKLTYHEVYVNGELALSAPVETKTDAQNRIISEDYQYNGGLTGMKWSYEYGSNGKIKKWTTDSYMIIIGITGTTTVDYTSYNNYGLCTERILTGVQMGTLASRTKEKMFYENQNKIVRGETWEDENLTNQYTMSSYDIFYYGGIGTGIETITNDELQITVCPNPTTGLLQVTSDKLQVTSVEVFDVMGKCHSSLVTCHSSLVTLNISHLPTGIYFVKIQTENETITKKVIKN